MMVNSNAVTLYNTVKKTHYITHTISQRLNYSLLACFFFLQMLIPMKVPDSKKKSR